MMAIFKLPAHDFIAHVLKQRGVNDYARDEKHIYVSCPDSIDEVDKSDSERWNALMDLVNIGLCRYNNEKLESVPEANDIFKQILPAIAIGWFYNWEADPDIANRMCDIAQGAIEA